MRVTIISMKYIKSLEQGAPKVLPFTIYASETHLSTSKFWFFGMLLKWDINADAGGYHRYSETCQGHGYLCFFNSYILLW